LYKAVENQEESVDVTGFHLPGEKVVASSECLYQPAGLQLYYMQYARCSKDFNTVKFTYTDSGEAITKNQNIFYLEMNHLLYNVAPKDYTPLQRFFSVYDYITKLADYSDNLEDYSTLTVNSILVQHKGICGAYSLLANYVLNFVGVKTYSVSNEPHAWNVVELNGSRYHSDF
jgi:transglutaminase/protease-like cytokinesis protein 3